MNAQPEGKASRWATLALVTGVCVAAAVFAGFAGVILQASFFGEQPSAASRTGGQVLVAVGVGLLLVPPVLAARLLSRRVAVWIGVILLAGVLGVLWFLFGRPVP